VKKFRRSKKAGILLLMIGFTVVLFSACLMGFYSFEAYPISGTQGWAEGEWVFVPPKGYFIKVCDADRGDNIGGSYQSSERFHVYLFDEENFLKFTSGAPNYIPLSSTLWSNAACYYGTSLKDGRFYVVIHNPSNRVAVLYSCFHFFDTESILIPKSENYISLVLLSIGGLLSVTGLVTLIWLKVYEKKWVSPAQ
jgi:hypothetical protein